MHYSVYAPFLDKEEIRIIGEPEWRLYLNSKKWSLIIALRSKWRIQSWNFRRGYTDKWRWIVISPARNNRCNYLIGDRQTCPLRKGHRGLHWDWRNRRRFEPAPVRLGQQIVDV